ncbi:MAG: EamA family transporter [Hyphomicrobiales bacterium]|nr:EamA family transporter [Hyphomicrobiales bacterium]MCY4038658.1 EamA family transporter [Hyphomicrobiales bacterium]
MEGALWGLGAAFGFGVGDFIARFTSRRMGAELSLLVVIFLGFAGFSVWLFWPTANLLQESDFYNFFTGRGLLFAIAAGATNVFGLLALYKALARGPVSLAAPIVSAYPAVVLLYLLPFGFVPGAVQLFGIVATLGGVALLSRLAESQEQTQDGDSQKSHASTIRISLVSMCLVALGVLFSQEVALLHGPILSTWAMRGFGLLFILVWILRFHRDDFARTSLAPQGIRIALIAQAALEAAGNLFLLLSSEGDGRPLAAVFASTFAVVVVLLGWIVLRERITFAQWISMAVILLGVMILSAVQPL